MKISSEIRSPSKKDELKYFAQNKDSLATMTQMMQSQIGEDRHSQMIQVTQAQDIKAVFTASSKKRTQIETQTPDDCRISIQSAATPIPFTQKFRIFKYRKSIEPPLPRKIIQAVIHPKEFPLMQQAVQTGRITPIKTFIQAASQNIPSFKAFSMQDQENLSKQFITVRNTTRNHQDSTTLRVFPVSIAEQRRIQRRKSAMQDNFLSKLGHSSQYNKERNRSPPLQGQSQQMAEPIFTQRRRTLESRNRLETLYNSDYRSLDDNASRQDDGNTVMTGGENEPRDNHLFVFDNEQSSPKIDQSKTHFQNRNPWRTHNECFSAQTETDGSFYNTAFIRMPNLIERPLKSNPFYLKSSYGPRRNVFKGGQTPLDIDEYPDSMLSVKAVPAFNPPGLDAFRNFKTKTKIFSRPTPPSKKVSLVSNVPQSLAQVINIKSQSGYL